MKRQTKHRLGTAIAGITFALIVAVPTLAIGPVNGHGNAHAANLPPQSPGTGLQRQAQGSSQGQGQGQGQAQGQANGQQRLTDAKLKSCQNRQTAISNIMARIADRGQKQLDLFTTIADRVETFYTKEGKTLNNYDTLVADVNTEKAAAQTAVDSIKSADTGFDCNSSNPKAFVETFQGSLKSEISALQTYRTSVKNLIVGVKSVVGTTSSASAGQGGTNNTNQPAQNPTQSQAPTQSAGGNQ